MSFDWSTSINQEIDSLKHKKPLKEDTIKTLFSKVVNNQRDHVLKETPNLRFSKLPVCNLLYTIEMLSWENEVKKVAYSQDFFTSIGTAIHEVLQTHFPLTEGVKDFVFGDWICTNPQCNHQLSMVVPKGLFCLRCNSPLKYKEIEVCYKGIKGHIDLVLLIDGFYYLLDFKTASQRVIDNKRLPYPKNVMQIEGYCLAFTEQFGLNVKSYSLIYLSRDSTDLSNSYFDKSFVHVHSKACDKKVLERAKRQLDSLVTTKRQVESYLKDPSEKRLKALNDNRPCLNFDDYENKHYGMKHAFVMNDCPYMMSCCKSKGLTEAAKEISDITNKPKRFHLKRNLRRA